MFFVRWGLVVSTLDQAYCYTVRTAMETARSDEMRTENVRSCMIDCCLVM
jgi:hypothetical protein